MTTPVSTCGFDGKCDGAGGCRKYPVNTMCKPGMCDGDAVVGSNACDGNGQCKPGSTHICVPFSCNAATGSCVAVCTSNSQCVSGHQCKDGSCGLLMIGAICQRNDQCASNFCADGVCCNVACQGPCLSCNLMGREGTCWPVDADQPDPRGICRDMGRSTCGQTGLCDGIGSCSKYARDTECIAPTCSGTRLNTAGTCNGLGTCRPQGLQDCYPFRCAGGACTTTCTTNADCAPGIACVNNSCGLKQDGQMCQASSECEHNHCVDGICCDQACGGACRSCALAAALGALHADRRRHRRSARRVHGDAAVDLLHQRQVRRQRRLPELAGRHAVRGRDLQPGRQPLQAAVDLQRQRPVRGARSDPVQPVHLQRRRAASTPAPTTTSA